MLTSEQLRERRLELRLSQAELALVLGCTREHLSRMENGKVPISHTAMMMVMLLKKSPALVNAAIAYGRAIQDLQNETSRLG